MNYITTYFYQEENDDNSSYGNIDRKFDERNIIYWKTVYCLFYTSIIINPNAKHVLFTNANDFPFKNEIQRLGVKVFDELKLTNKNIGKWASVKFFFDVIDYISESKFFDNSDKIIMLDTDCIAVNSSSDIFNSITSKEPILAYLNGVERNSKTNFHGQLISNLNSIYNEVNSSKISIKEKIGGEFFAFQKSGIYDFISSYSLLLKSKYEKQLITEEQILSMIHADTPFFIDHKGVHRTWTTIKYNTIPDNIDDYSFLHLPSEKEYALSIIFNLIYKKKLMSRQDLRELIYSVTNLKSKRKLIVYRAIRIFSERLKRK